ncbi:hypothetical protein [Saccharothrix texasensis]|uniref:Uncharacterized protein n=1 Tax=Saccharothrix texasensis TaxID=103734 RepID=A0A3N1H8X2_9PSEU|nr:hypothetical protein [Saccharothrix texasensis]ROP38963.1 hypothetical protein EDD40_4330 [Saccharothrix texasensis]
MAIVSRKVSDLSGTEGGDADFAQVVVRQHPSIDQPKALDVLVGELGMFKDIGDLVILEVRMPDTTTREIYVRVNDFNKAAPDMEQVLQSARGTRGRLPGSRNGS